MCVCVKGKEELSFIRLAIAIFVFLTKSYNSFYYRLFSINCENDRGLVSNLLVSAVIVEKLLLGLPFVSSVLTIYKFILIEHD